MQPRAAGVDLAHTRWRWQLSAILGLSCALGISLVYANAELPAVLDEREYLAAGRALASGHGIEYRRPSWNELTQPPLYAWFLGLVFASGGDVVAVKLLQVLLSAAGSGLVASLTRRALGPRAGLWAAALLAFDPTLIAFTHYLWSETLGLFWLALASWLLFDRDARPASATRCFASGVGFGLLALTRSYALYLPSLLALWLLASQGGRRAARLRAALLLAGFCACLAPHAISVYRKYGDFVLVNSTALVWYRSYNFHEPFNVDWGFLESRSQKRARENAAPASLRARPRVTGGTPATRSREEMRRALRYAWENPSLVARHSAMRLAEFLNPTSFLIRHIRLGFYELDANREPTRPPLAPGLREAIVLLAVASAIGLMTLAVLGLVSMPRSPMWNFLLIAITYTLGVHALSVGMSRYRLVLMPFLAIAASHFAAAPRTRWRVLHEPWRGALAIGILAALAAIWSLHLGKIWER
jgi:4-amino-4-deoxy-L-arabinose transferase-like glycosyltransferase